MSKPRVAILHYSAPPVVGGVETVIKEHARLLIRNGYSTTVVTGRGDRAALAPGARLIQIPEMDSLDSNISRISALLEGGQVPGDFEKMTRRIKDRLAPTLENFDCVIIHNILTKHFNLPLTAAIHRLMDAGAVSHGIAWCHDFTWTSQGSRHKVHPGYPWDLLRSYRPDMTYVVVSRRRQLELADLMNRSARDIQVIHNGVEPGSLLGLSELGTTLVARLGLFESDLTLLMPVRVTRAKNIEFALRVTQALKAQVDTLRLVITGPPDPHSVDSLAYFGHLKALRQELGVENEVRFVFESGPSGDPLIIGPEEVGELYRVCDLAFIPSLREGFGMPIIEASLSGIPILSTDIPAVEEVGREHMMVFSVTDLPEQVASRIVAWLHSCPQHQLRRRVRQNFTWDTVFRTEIEPLLVI